MQFNIATYTCNFGKSDNGDVKDEFIRLAYCHHHVH